MKRTSLWIFTLGGLMVLLGLLMFLAGLMDPKTRTLSPGSAFVFSTGALLIGAGFMFRAREVEEHSRPNREAVQQRQNLLRVNGVCAGCKREPAIVRCNLHNVKLCGACMVPHDTVYCEYVPCGRKSIAKTGVRR